jgi:hypothetical protein
MTALHACIVCFQHWVTPGGGERKCDSCNPTGHTDPRIKRARAALNADPQPESGP